jgi:hypothetical protein
VKNKKTLRELIEEMENDRVIVTIYKDIDKLELTSEAIYALNLFEKYSYI